TVQFVTRVSSWVTASSAPGTLYRCRPGGAGRNSRMAAQTYPRNGPKTKWAASTNSTARSPRSASASRGRSSPCRNAACASGSALAGTWPTFRQDNPRPVKEHPDLRQAAAQAGQLLDHPPRLPGRPRRVPQEVVLQRLGVGRQRTLGPAEVHPPQGRDAAGEVLVEVALDGAAAQ